MNSNVWAKSTLTVYPYLVKISEAIDRMIERRAINSFYVSGSNYLSNNIYDLANKLIDLSERKITLINLKILVENTLKKCERDYAKLLIAKYMSKKKSGELCEMFSLSRRTYFRKIKEAEEKFDKQLLKQGFDASKFEEMLKNENWILDVKRTYEKSSDMEACETKISRREIV